MVDSGKESKQGSVLLSPLDEGSKNKRKLGDPCIEKTTNPPTSLTELPPYGFSAEIPPSSLSAYVSLEVGLDQPKEAVVGAFECADWDDPITCQLEELLLSNLQAIFRSAIKQISECGCSGEDAEKTILRGGLYIGGKDPVSNIVNDTLTFVKKSRDVDCSRYNEIDNLQHLAEYTLLEMISVLREVRSLSVGEAMWLLLIYDLNVLQACVLEDDSLSDLGCKNFSGDSSCDSATLQLRSETQGHKTMQPKPNEEIVSNPSPGHTPNHLPETLKFGSFQNSPKDKTPQDLEGLTQERESMEYMLDNLEKCLNTASQISASEEKSGAGRRGTKKEIAVLRQSSFHIEKNYRNYGSGGRLGKLAAFGGFVLEKGFKPLSEHPGGLLKIGSSKGSAEVKGKAPLTYGKRSSSTNTSSASLETKSLPKTPGKGTKPSLRSKETKLCQKSNSEKKSSPTPPVSTSESPKIPDYCAGILHDKSVGEYVPADEKDVLILKLVSRLQELQNELHGWTEWANQKVMQAAHRLIKNLPELKMLRQEKKEVDEYNRERKMLEENTIKRLSEMKHALNNATAHVEKANSTACRFEVENSLLKMELETAKQKVLESSDSYHEALEREQKALKQAQAMEGQKRSLQEELETEKCKVAVLQQDIIKEKSIYYQIEARWERMRMEKEKLLAQVASIRNEREQYEVLSKLEKDIIKQNAEIDIKECLDDIRKLETKLSEMTLKHEKSKIAALKRGAAGSFGSSPPEARGIMTVTEDQSFTVFNREVNFQEDYGNGGLKQERECALCLSEEISVVFIPCAHQVVCAKCNELHEKQGMKDCPSCRTTIQRRINVHFVRP
ncbi:hypothetical protein FNV43_RR23444 [Rhamnella rubrinervis]|uniref:RING-type domain-containing protein n=1 Tax=Rhamnella rubrinervis TaxID=2594499 RepID=A0A8K0DS09_9ROSA|nr:hypothetical protein FNV43_RR23444 [Rhamnella rubrinervis]